MSELTSARICQVVDKIYALYPALTTKPNRVLNVALRLTAQHFVTASLDSSDHTRRVVFSRVFARVPTDTCEEFSRMDLKTFVRAAAPAAFDKRDILVYMLDAASPTDTTNYYTECVTMLHQTLSNIVENRQNSDAETLQAIVPDITILLTALSFVARIAAICGESTHSRMTWSVRGVKDVLMTLIPPPHNEDFSVLFRQLLNRSTVAYVPYPDHEAGLFGPTYVWYLEALAEGKLSDKQDKYLDALKRVSEVLKLTFQTDKDMCAVAYESLSSLDGKAARDRYHRASSVTLSRTPWIAHQYQSLNAAVASTAKSVEDYFFTSPLIVKWFINAFLSALKFTKSAVTSTDMWPCVTYVPPPPVVQKQRVVHKKRLIYAVAIGRNPGIYETWEEAKEMVDRYPGNRHKSFPANRQGYLDAESYIEHFQNHHEEQDNQDYCSEHEAPAPHFLYGYYCY